MGFSNAVGIINTEWFFLDIVGFEKFESWKGKLVPKSNTLASTCPTLQNACRRIVSSDTSQKVENLIFKPFNFSRTLGEIRENLPPWNY